MRSATGIPSPRAPPAAPGPGERWHAAGPHALGRGDARAAEAKQAAAGRCSTPRPRVPASGDRAEEPEPPPPRPSALLQAPLRGAGWAPQLPAPRAGSAGERQPAVGQQREELGKGEPEGTSPWQSSPPGCSSGPVFIPPPAPKRRERGTKARWHPGFVLGRRGRLWRCEGELPSSFLQPRTQPPHLHENPHWPLVLFRSKSKITFLRPKYFPGGGRRPLVRADDGSRLRAGWQLFALQ